MPGLQVWNDLDKDFQMPPRVCVCVCDCERMMKVDILGFVLLHNVFVLFVTCYLILVPGPLLNALKLPVSLLKN